MSVIESIKAKYSNLGSDERFAEILTGSSYALIARVVATFLSMLTSILIARVYGPEVLGVLAVINSILVATTIITTFGTNISVLRLIPEYIAKGSMALARQVYGKIQFVVVVAAVAAGVLLFLSSKTVASGLFGKPSLAFYLELTSIAILFRSLIDLTTQSIRGLKLVRTFAVMQIVPQAVTLLGLIILSLMIEDHNMPVYAQIIAWGVSAVAGVLIAHNAFGQHVSTSAPEGDAVSLRTVLGVSLPMFVTSMFGYLSGEVGTFILGIYRPESEVGYYSVAVKLATLTAFVLASINTIAAPKFSELYHQHKMDELFHVARKSTKLIFWTTVPVLIGLLAFGQPIIRIFFGTKYAGAYRPMVFLVIGQFVNSISGSTGLFMNMTDKHRILTMIVASAAVMNIGLNVLLVPRIGMNGAAIAGMVSLVLWNVVISIYIKMKYGKTIGYVPIWNRGYFRA